MKPKNGEVLHCSKHYSCQVRQCYLSSISISMCIRHNPSDYSDFVSYSGQFLHYIQFFTFFKLFIHFIHVSHRVLLLGIILRTLLLFIHTIYLTLESSIVCATKELRTAKAYSRKSQG